MPETDEKLPYVKICKHPPVYIFNLKYTIMGGYFTVKSIGFMKINENYCNLAFSHQKVVMVLVY